MLKLKGKSTMKNYYEILEVMPDASLEVIKASYKALVKKMHPDNGGSAECEGKTIEDVNEAFEVLSDSVKREEYDFKWEKYYSGKTSSGSEKSQMAGNGYSEKEEVSNCGMKKKLMNVITAFIVWIIVRFIDVPMWIIIGVAFFLVLALADFLSPCLIRSINNLYFVEKKWNADDNLTVESFLFFMGLRIMFNIYDISNWLTKLCTILLVMALVLLVMKIVETVADINVRSKTDAPEKGYCPQCKAPVSESERFCRNCGNKLR